MPHPIFHDLFRVSGSRIINRYTRHSRALANMPAGTKQQVMVAGKFYQLRYVAWCIWHNRPPAASFISFRTTNNRSLEESNLVLYSSVHHKTHQRHRYPRSMRYPNVYWNNQRGGWVPHHPHTLFRPMNTFFLEEEAQRWLDDHPPIHYRSRKKRSKRKHQEFRDQLDHDNLRHVSYTTEDRLILVSDYSRQRLRPFNQEPPYDDDIPTDDIEAQEEIVRRHCHPKRGR